MSTDEQREWDLNMRKFWEQQHLGRRWRRGADGIISMARGRTPGPRRALTEEPRP